MIRLACERPADSEVPLARWSSTELAAEVVSRGICEQISGVTVWRWLSEDAIKPCQYRSWIFPRDPEFTANAGRIFDLYAGRWDGELLHPGDRVVCCDEKPSIQARCRKHATLPAARVKRGQRVEHEYDRRGALCYFAAWDARRAKLFDRCDDKDGIVPFDGLVEQLMTVRALQQGPTRVRDRRQRLRAPRPSVDQAPPRPIQEPDPRPHPGARQLAQPSRDLLLHRAAQGADPQPLPRPLNARATTARVSVAATSRSPTRSNGSSPAPTSTDSQNASNYPPPRPPNQIRARTSEPEH